MFFGFLQHFFETFGMVIASNEQKHAIKREK